MDKQFSLNNFSRPRLEMPGDEKKLLLHSCCAPCAGEIMEALAASDIQTTVYFYNPNIHPQKEYEIRKDENKRFCDKLGFNFVDADYDKENWFERIKGLENAPERGKRCTQCFDMRFESQLFMHMKMVLRFMELLLEFHVGKIWIKSMIRVIGLPNDMKISIIGILIGAKKVVPHE